MKKSIIISIYLLAVLVIHNNFDTKLAGILYTYLLAPGLIFYLSEFITWKSIWINKLRSKIKILNKKPFTCTPCIFFWLNLITMTSIYPSAILFNILMSFTLYIIVYFIDKMENYKQFNLTPENDNLKFDIKFNGYLNNCGDEKYNLIIMDKKSNKIVDLDFNSNFDRNQYLQNWLLIFNK